jgi:hypothetical protein
MQLVAIYGEPGAAQLLLRRPTLISIPPDTLLRGLAAMALAGVAAPEEAAARTPILLQYRHDGPAVVTARLALQRYLHLGAAEVWRWDAEVFVRRAEACVAHACAPRPVRQPGAQLACRA